MFGKSFVFTTLLLIMVIRFTFGERKICSAIERSQNIMYMIVDITFCMYAVYVYYVYYVWYMYYDIHLSIHLSAYPFFHVCSLCKLYMYAVYVPRFVFLCIYFCRFKDYLHLKLFFVRI